MKESGFGNQDYIRVLLPLYPITLYPITLYPIPYTPIPYTLIPYTLFPILSDHPDIFSAVYELDQFALSFVPELVYTAPADNAGSEGL